MKKETLIILIALLFLQFLSSCDSGTSLSPGAVSTDTATIAKGKASFYQNCSGCHSFKQDGIGPALGGLTDSVSPDWIKRFIRDPKKLIESGDERTVQLMKNHKSIMPSFALTDDELNGIIAFINMHKKYDRPRSKSNGKEVSNPMPDPVRVSGLVANLELVIQFPASGDSDERARSRLAKLDFEPSSGNSFVLDLQGELYKMQNNKPVLYMNLAKLCPKIILGPGLATGFCSFAFHPDFAKNGLLYTLYTESPASGKADFSYADSFDVTMQGVLTEWKTKNPGAGTFSGTKRELLRVDIMTDSHGVQEISFNPLSKPGDEDYGMLYMSIGDGGSVQVGYPFLLHGIETIWGSILRIDPFGRNSTNGQYGIPLHNPFTRTQNPKALGEIYAYGFRNPHRMTWTKSGEMLVFNIGQANIESVNLVKPGHNYGWPTREGNFLFDPYGDLSKIYPLPSNDSSYNITYPVAQYDHDEGMAISGGCEYWGTTIPQLKGKLLFGDIPTGRLFYIEMADVKQGKLAPVKEWKISINGTNRTLRELCGNDRVDLHFGRDSRGELYLLTKADGKMYKIVSADLKAN
jgi:glucose/arabinose dehydrogenase/mono/diheme cytochrome c family protein